MPTKMKTEKQYRWWTVGIAYSEVPNGEGRDAGIGEGRAGRGGGTMCEPGGKDAENGHSQMGQRENTTV